MSNTMVLIYLASSNVSDVFDKNNSNPWIASLDYYYIKSRRNICSHLIVFLHIYICCHESKRRFSSRPRSRLHMCFFHEVDLIDNITLIINSYMFRFVLLNIILRLLFTLDKLITNVFEEQE